MQVGFSLANNMGIADAQVVIDLARRAEALGFDSVWVHDHVFNAERIAERLGDRPYYDPLTILTYVAAVTERIRLGTSVLVLPYHNPLRLAKEAATLDVLSGGRLIMGVGVGSIPAESEALGSPYAERGAITDEAIAIMKELWTAETPSFAGRYHSFSGMKFSPKPVQRPHIPIWIGGSSRAAVRRAVRVGDGWQPLRLSVDELSEGLTYLRAQAAVAGRDPDSIAIAISVNFAHPYAMIERARRLADLGVSHIHINANSGDPNTLNRALEVTAREVLPALRYHGSGGTP